VGAAHFWIQNLAQILRFFGAETATEWSTTSSNSGQHVAKIDAAFETNF